MIRFPHACIALLVVASVTAPVLAQQVQVVPPDEVGNYWIMTKSEVDGMVPNSGRNLDKPGCAAVSYMIGSDGIPRGMKARKVVPSNSDFGPIAVSLVRNFRYAPTDDNSNDQPINTYYIVRFNMPKDPAQKKALLARCALPGYSHD